MRRLAIILALTLPLPLAAQDPGPPAEDSITEGFELFGQGMRSMLEGLFTEMQPAISDMSRALAELRPMAEQLLGLIDDIGNYQAPVILDNGDILIRRKPAPPTPPREGEIDL